VQGHVQASEPSTPVDEGVRAVDEKLNKGMAVAGTIVGKIKWPVLIVLVALVGYWVYGKFWGPRAA